MSSFGVWIWDNLALKTDVSQTSWRLSPPQSYLNCSINIAAGVDTANIIFPISVSFPTNLQTVFLLPWRILCLSCGTINKMCCLSQHVTVEDSYLCGYLKINGLTEVSLQATSWVVRLTFILLKSIHWLVSPRFKQAAMWQSTLDQWFTTFPLQKQKILKNLINQLMSKRRAKFNWLHQPTFF